MDIPRFRTYVEEVPGHKCDLNTRLVVDLMVYGTEHPTTTERCLGAFRKVCVVSRHHPFTKNMFRSTTAIAAEVTRHMETAPYIIHPYSRFRCFYEIFMLGVGSFYSVFVPLYFWVLSCWNDINYDYIFLTLCGIYWIDIILIFFTGYVDKKLYVVVLDKKQIAKHYFLTYFFIDALSSFPYSFVFSWKTNLLPFESFCWIDVICALKLFRIPTMLSYYKQVCLLLGIDVIPRQICRTTFAVLFYLHWVACCCSSISVASRELFAAEPPRNHSKEIWVNRPENLDSEITWRNAMLRAITLTFSCGFRMVFIDMGDMVGNIIFFLLGIVIVVLVAVRVVMIGRSMESTGSQYETLHTNLVEYMRRKKVSRPLERRLSQYYSFAFEHTYYREPVIMSFLSGQLQKDLLLLKGRELMDATDIFEDFPPAVISRLVAGLRINVVLPGDVVLRMGKPADRMVYVSSGTLAVYDVAGKELCHLRDGEVMGEESLVTVGQVLGVTVIALEPSELWFLTRAYFLAATREGASSIVAGRKVSIFPRHTQAKLKRRFQFSIPPMETTEPRRET